MHPRDNKRLRLALRAARAQLDAAASSEDDRRLASRALAEIDVALAKLGEAPPSSTSTPAVQAPKKDLLSIICHDLKDPLASIVMGAGFLRKVIPDTTEFASSRRIVDAIARSSERMNGVIGDFYDLGKIEAGQLVVEMRVVDAASLVRTAFDTFGPKAKDKSLELVDAIAIGEGELPIACDRARMLQAIAKLLQNAIKFTPEGGTIRLEARSKDDGVEIAVVDTGRGIAEDRRATVFDRDANWKATPRDGPGLGLAIAKGIVELHGGRIGVASASESATDPMAAAVGDSRDPRGGARAWIWLPRARA